MPASNVFMNWSALTVTPTSPTGTAITLDTILDIQINGKSVQKAFYGDALSFPKLVRNCQKERTITIVAANVSKLLTVPEDAECTIAVNLLDAINGAAVGGGGIAISAVRAKRGSSPFGGKNNEFAGISLTFMCAGGTSDADPISVTAL